jgi:hypothetical protein
MYHNLHVYVPGTSSSASYKKIVQAVLAVDTTKMNQYGFATLTLVSLAATLSETAFFCTALLNSLTIILKIVIIHVKAIRVIGCGGE